MNKGLVIAAKTTMILIFLFFSIFLIYRLLPSFASESLTQIWTADPNGAPKTDFSPEETVYILGKDFLADAYVNISVTRPNGVIDTGSELTDPYGTFEYEYALDGITGVYFVFATDGTNTANVIFNDSSGAIWTTKNDCGDEQQDINHYKIGDHIYINGAGFSSGSKEWSITGRPGGASCDPNIVVASGNVNINSSGSFCFDAYTVQVGDCGVYQVKVGTKGDNYQVGDWCDQQTEQKECTDAGCFWCEQCKYDVFTTKTNQWLTGKCVVPETDCGWHCEKGYCGATCSNGLDCSCPKDTCVGNDYYDYPANGICKDCTTSCYCQNGTGSGQPCYPTIVKDDPRCITSLCEENETEIDFLYESKPNSAYVDNSSANVSYKLCNSSQISVDTSDGKTHYIYINWNSINVSDYDGAYYFDLMLNHYEDSTLIKVQLKNQTGSWIDVCNPPESSFYIWSTCDLKPYWNILKDVPVIELRVVTWMAGTCHEYLGCAKLKVKLYRCEPQEYCGDGLVKEPEECELPDTNNNPFCDQTTTECLGYKLGQRDAFGDCDAFCGCIDDPFTYSCVEGQCGAVCDEDTDCQNYCDGDIRYYGGYCDFGSTCDCSYETEDCDKDGCYAYENGCELRNYYCAVSGCEYDYSDRKTDYYDNSSTYCSDGQIKQHGLYHDFYCDSGCLDHASWQNDTTLEDCDDKDGWYDTGNTKLVPIGECAEKEEKEQEYRDYTCSPTPTVACTYDVTDTKWVDTGEIINKPISTTCELDGDKCTVDHCDGSGACVKKEDVDCSYLDDQCQQGVCNPSDGSCYSNYFEISTPCEADGNKCTLDHCDGLGECVNFDNIFVPEPEDCKSFYCDPFDGIIKEDYTDYPLSTFCEADDDECTMDHCDGSGQCVFWKNASIISNFTKTIGEPKTRCLEGEWCEWKITTLTPITLSCDYGKVKWRYALDGEWKDWHEDDSPVTILFPEESNHTLEAYCEGVCGTGSHDIEKFKVEGKAFEIPLYKKWNLISVPFVLINENISEVFKNISSYISAVWTYDNGVWYLWEPTLGGTLDSIKSGWGYWVLAKNDTRLLIAGNLFSPIVTPPRKDLQEGWNLIGYYGTEWQTYEIESDNCGYDDYKYGNYVYCSLNSLIDTQQGFPRWSSLWGYDNCGDDEAYWHELDSCIGDYWGLNKMFAGKGYWIEMDVQDGYAPATNCIWNSGIECLLAAI